MQARQSLSQLGTPQIILWRLLVGILVLIPVYFIVRLAWVIMRWSEAREIRTFQQLLHPVSGAEMSCCSA